MLVERFRNPAVADTSRRLCAFASDRIPPWVMPVAAFNVDHGGPVDICALTVAAWARSLLGQDDTGCSIEHTDNRAELLEQVGRSLDTDPLALLREPALVGDFRPDERFVTAYLRASRLLSELGARGAALVVADGLSTV